MDSIAKFFKLQEHGTTIQREILGGITTFLAMSYIIFVQPGVLSVAGMNFQAVLTATCLAAAAGTLLMGLAANYPVALAPGITAIAAADDSVKMARAMKLAVEAGRLACEAGRMPRKLYASASSPLAGVVGR